MYLEPSESGGCGSLLTDLQSDIEVVCLKTDTNTTFADLARSLMSQVDITQLTTTSKIFFYTTGSEKIKKICILPFTVYNVSNDGHNVQIDFGCVEYGNTTYTNLSATWINNNLSSVNVNSYNSNWKLNSYAACYNPFDVSDSSYHVNFYMALKY